MVLAVVGILQIAGQKRGRGFNIGDARHLIDRMDVASRQGQREGRDTRAGALDCPGVGAAARQNL